MHGENTLMVFGIDFGFYLAFHFLPNARARYSHRLWLERVSHTDTNIGNINAPVSKCSRYQIRTPINLMLLQRTPWSRRNSYRACSGIPLLTKSEMEERCYQLSWL